MVLSLTKEEHIDEVSDEHHARGAEEEEHDKVGRAAVEAVLLQHARIPEKEIWVTVLWIELTSGQCLVKCLEKRS